ncbi:prolyl 3-hydroxylase OGFOD1 isoform X2 [Latimeria chalumnae]|uniref:Prolyl 3-hydroxylase OGFOD1 n=1 Tax=Latimeria chalumnae TaxID=7897 RepID=M3XLB8_LATCH|nr:PREDICTED: prolyl 3-hydroxylase OGFOD1 isoform X2 [Latimeria chalumnae]|eukprot:XP_006000793.1 PREDICTED: prolyl 3-hydroxylase OGFOD1 isoform X2 [Latimeria chalumnae]
MSAEQRRPECQDRRRGPQDDPHQAPGRKKAREKQAVTAQISGSVREEAGNGLLREAWRSGLKYRQRDEGGLELDSKPFPHCVIPNFLEDNGFLEELRDELLKLNFHQKSNDLYKFKQSDDLKRRKEPHISALRKVLFEDFRKWLFDVTQIELESTVDISCAKYEHTDVLLCHDDELEGRRIAFILYLVPSWESSDGGMLDLYSSDVHYQPVQIMKSLLPSWNTLAFFEVSSVSHHQVSEVLSESKSRLSVSGWFHGSSLERPPRYVEPSLPRTPHLPRDHEVLYEWLNPVYLQTDAQAQIQEEFEERSEILLKNFLQAEKFQQVCEALTNVDMKWILRGPPNKRCYEQVEEGSLPEILRQCMELLHSEPMFLLLSNFTGLKLHFLASSNEEDEDEEAESSSDSSQHAEASSSRREVAGAPPGANIEVKERDTELDGQQAVSQLGKRGTEAKESVPVCRGELRHWRHGHYTLLHDTDVENAEFALDLLLFCGCEGWEAEFGGFTSYIAKGEDEELLTIYPENNSLALIYRDKETLKFVKHVNQRSSQRWIKVPTSNGFWDFSFAYYE